MNTIYVLYFNERVIGFKKYFTYTIVEIDKLICKYKYLDLKENNVFEIKKTTLKM